MIKKIFGAVLGMLASSNLKPLTERQELRHGFINPYPNGRFNAPFRSNGASRKRKTNRIHLSRKTRNKHR